MLPFEFLVQGRPVPFQKNTKSKNKNEWKLIVRSIAEKTWKHLPMNGEDLHVSIVYLSKDSPNAPCLIDADNIIKYILDALVGLVYTDDNFVTDVESHRRYLAESIDVTALSTLLLKAVDDNEECVYVRIEKSKSLGDYL